jgi:hypothetical protein
MFALFLHANPYQEQSEHDAESQRQQPCGHNAKDCSDRQPIVIVGRRLGGACHSGLQAQTFRERDLRFTEKQAGSVKAWKSI